jgi:DNA helicase HerA-like ATPase
LINNTFGLTTTDSTSKTIAVVAKSNEKLVSVVGRMVYMDAVVDGELYRSIGTITDIKTVNPGFNIQYEAVAAKNFNPPQSADLRKLSFNIQATFRKDESSQKWEKHSSALPTSPSTLSPVEFLTEDIVAEMTASEIYPTIGYFRGMGSAPQPLMIPDFGGNTGASHSAVIGRSGSGKTAFYTYVLSTFMSHEHHAIVVIDPQGQWSNENGMVMSSQNFAKGLGRKVNVLRVSEDIKLPMNEDIFTRMLNKLRLWSKFRRMGAENLDAVASRIARRKNFDVDPRELLSKVFAEIAYSESALSRIYTKGERRDDFKRDLLMLAGEPIIDPESGEQELLSSEDRLDIEENWENILSIFSPLINLFSSENINGTKRRPLGGEYGFLGEVFQIRSPQSGPAPYVVLDMSPSVELHAKADLLGNANSDINMQKILDNQDVKALIIMMVLDEMKRASESAFAKGGGNLNTQIVFDEAWRFAPEGKATPEIEELASMLEGFALDTRKFGIGWTYILQSPADLKYGIWKQLTYVYVGYGLVGEDIKRLEALTDDSKQLDLYRQFIPPKSTGIYPFMLMGPISPIIFTTAPAFINVFNNNQDFLHYNREWIERITNKRALPNLTLDYLTQSLVKKEKFTVTDKEEIKSFKVGKDEKTVKVKPQVAVKPKSEIQKTHFDDGLDDMPF